MKTRMADHGPLLNFLPDTESALAREETKGVLAGHTGPFSPPLPNPLRKLECL
jgi:hypothetical protein